MEGSGAGFEEFDIRKVRSQGSIRNKPAIIVGSEMERTELVNQQYGGLRCF